MPHRLLLADDSVTVQRVIELTFADEGIEVVAVGDGDAAIARLQQERFDVVLADVGMPGRTGYEVAQFLKDRTAADRPPVILLTGAFEPVDQARVADAGAAAVLAKPFEPQMVIAKVRELLGGARVRPAASTETPSPEAPVPPPPDSAAAPAATVDEYFDRLDRAFASLNPLPEAGETPASSSAAVRGHADAVVSRAQGPCPSSGAGDYPAGEAPLPATRPVAHLADRFATMLAVEQGELPASALAAPASADDELVDRIARRVVEALGDRAVRDLAADIVSRTAERLVREEIERIKAGI